MVGLDRFYMGDVKKRIKICGLSRECDIAMVNDLGPDFCGFIINFPKSKRNISVDRLRELVKDLVPDVVPVGVFVNQPVELIAGLLNDNVIGVAQLHGSEDDDYILRLKALTEKTIWKAFQIREKSDIMAVNGCQADFVIIDSGQGSGKVFDWSLLEVVERPFGLAGGLSLDNVDEALKTSARLLDVSGGVETDGFKDCEKVKNFIERVRK